LPTRNINVGLPFNGAMTIDLLKTTRANWREKADEDQSGHDCEQKHAGHDLYRA